MNIDRLRQLAGLNEDEKDFEKVAFGDLKGSDEEDTNFEDKVFNALDNFIQYASPSNKTDADAILKDVHALKAKYPDELVPDAKHAYRGTQLSVDKYKKFLAMYPAEKLETMDQFSFLHVADIMYTPRSPIQSWTTNDYTAMNFAATGETAAGYDWVVDFPFPAVLEARVDTTFIMSTNITNRIADKHNLPHENEIIRTDGSPMSCKVHVIVDWLVQARLHLES
jgi:hypothetical protein